MYGLYSKAACNQERLMMAHIWYPVLHRSPPGLYNISSKTIGQYQCQNKMTTPEDRNYRHQRLWLPALLVQPKYLRVNMNALSENILALCGSVLYWRKNIRTYQMVRATERTNIGTQDSYPFHFCNIFQIMHSSTKDLLR